MDGFGGGASIREAERLAEMSGIQQSLYPPIHDAITVTDASPVCGRCGRLIRLLGCEDCLALVVVVEGIEEID